MADYIIGIDIGGTNFRIGAITEDARILRHEIVSSRSYLTMENPLEALCEQIARFI